MTAGRNVLRTKDSAFEKFVRKVCFRIVRHCAVRREETGLGAKHNFLARETVRGEQLECGTDGSFTTLKPIIDRRVYQIVATFDGCNHSFGVALVRRSVGLA